MSAEPAKIDAWLYTTLHGDATLVTLCGGRAYNRPAVPYPSLPCIAYSLMGNARDSRSAGGVRVGSWFRYEVLAVGATDDVSAISAIADRIDTLLDNVSGTVTGWHWRSVREQAIERTDVLGGTTRYAQLGGVYRIWCAVG